ncbi:MAG: outer-membrane lipoprotein carrier protein LolA [Pyrinomonadaceae bacterium]
MNRKCKLGSIAMGLMLFLNVFAVTDVSAQDVLRQILNRMDQHNKSLTSLRASVSMAKYNAQLGGDPDLVNGTAVYLPQKGRDALVRIDWVKPDESLSVVNKEYVLYRPRLAQAITGKVNGSKSKGTNNALSFMNMSRDQLKANYSVRYLGEETVSSGTKTWHLELTPKLATGFKSAELWVDGNGMPIQAKVIEKNNDSTTVLLSNLEKNVSINASVFRINLPKGTKVIKS